VRTGYFDGNAGASGDMILGAVLDLGVPLGLLKDRLSGLGIGGFDIEASRVHRAGIRATRAAVRITETQHHRGLPDILRILDASALSDIVKRRAIQTFRRLVEAEAGIHGVPEDQVHLHEVGAVDAIVDVVGAMVAFEELGISRFCASALRLGYGRVRTAHGELPVPAPATLAILSGKPVFGGEIEGEFTTPTGAAILTTLCDAFGPMPALRPEKLGYGAGRLDPEGLPNVLRIVVGEQEDETSGDRRLETVVQMEAMLDDMNPELFGHLFDRLTEDGALEVVLCPVHTKKSRPAVLLSVLARPEQAPSLRERIFSETTTLGIRTHRMEREALARRSVMVKTPYGEIAVKEGLRGEKVMNFAPEYEDCRRAALDARVPLKAVFASAVAAYLSTDRR
jgi:uncharacterized protein (TIGR00299 family) protein